MKRHMLRSSLLALLFLGCMPQLTAMKLFEQAVKAVSTQVNKIQERSRKKSELLAAIKGRLQTAKEQLQRLVDNPNDWKAISVGEKQIKSHIHPPFSHWRTPGSISLTELDMDSAWRRRSTDEYFLNSENSPSFEENAYVEPKNKAEATSMLNIVTIRLKEVVEEIGDIGKNTGQELMAQVIKNDGLKQAAAAKQAVANEGAKERMSMLFSQLRNPVYAGILLALFGGGVAAYHGIPKLIARKPQVIAEMSFRTPLERLLGKKLPPSNIDKVVLAPGTNIKISRFTRRVQRVLAQGGEMMNMIFYGPPGTGKTMTAKAMARASGAEYMIINGAAFEQLPAAKIISELEGVFRLAKTSRKPVMIFWDEADAALGKRGGSNETIESRRLINTFLSNVSDTHNTKIMFILATNLPNTLDDAVLSRFPKEGWVYFGRPNVAERARILRMYLSDFLGAQPNQAASPDGDSSSALSPEVERDMEQFAQRLENATGRDIRALARGISDRMIDENITMPTSKLIHTVIGETQANEEEIGEYVYGQ